MVGQSGLARTAWIDAVGHARRLDEFVVLFTPQAVAAVQRLVAGDRLAGRLGSAPAEGHGVSPRPPCRRKNRMNHAVSSGSEVLAIQRWLAELACPILDGFSGR